MTEQDIIEMAKNAASIAKEMESEYEKVQKSLFKKYKYTPKVVPDYYPLYSAAVKNMEDIKVHAEKGVFPYRLFANRSPNQTDEEAVYIEKNYKWLTTDVFVDYLSTVGRAFHDPNWSVTYMPDADKWVTAGLTFQAYVETGIKNYGSIETFVKSIIPNIKATDAMGVIAVKPHEIPTIENGEETVIDAIRIFEPVPYYYKSSQIVAYEDDEFYLIETIEKSLVSHGGRTQKIGRVYEFYDKNNIYKVIQVGKYTDNEFITELYHSHNIGKVQARRLKGIPKYEDGQILWLSPFLYAVDNLDLVAMNAANLQISITKCAFPYAILLGDPCEFEENGIICNQGELNNISENTRKTCPSCHGSGLKSRLSPMGQMIVKAETRTNDTELRSSQKAVEYVSPPVDILDFLERNIKNNESRARRILHLKESNTAVQFNKENETATANNNDQKALYAFVKAVSDQTFDLYQDILDMVGLQRYGNDYEPAVLIYPQTFDFLTEEDYLKRITEAVNAGASPLVIHANWYGYLKAMYFNEKKTADIFNLIINTDRLLTFKNDEIALKASKGFADRWEVVLHDSAINFVNELVLLNDKFFELGLPIQKEQLTALAKKKADEIKPPETIKSTVEKILQPNAA